MEKSKNGPPLKPPPTKNKEKNKQNKNQTVGLALLCVPVRLRNIYIYCCMVQLYILKSLCVFYKMMNWKKQNPTYFPPGIDSCSQIKQ